MKVDFDVMRQVCKFYAENIAENEDDGTCHHESNTIFFNSRYPCECEYCPFVKGDEPDE